MNEPNPADPYTRFNPQTGLYEPVYWWREIMPFALYPDEQYTSGAMRVNAFGASPTPPFHYKLQHSSIGLDVSQGNSLGNPLLINEIVFEDSTDTTGLANFTVMLKDMGDQTQFMNQPIHVRNFAGPAILAAELSEPLFLPTRHQLLATLAKISGGAVDVRMFFWGQMHYTWGTSLLTHPMDRAIMFARVNKFLERRKYIFPFYLTTETPIITLLANQTQEFDCLIGDDGHFEASHILKVATSEKFAFEMFNPLTKQTYMNGPIEAAGAIGDARNPQELPVPIIVPAGQRIRMRFTDLSGSTNVLQVVLRGRKFRAPLKEWSQVQGDLAIKPIKNQAVHA